MRQAELDGALERLASAAFEGQDDHVRHELFDITGAYERTGDVMDDQIATVR